MQLERRYNSKVSLIAKIKHSFIHYLEEHLKLKDCMRWNDNQKLLPSVVSLLLLCFFPSQSFSDCAPAATNGNDIVSCNTPGTKVNNYNALSGNDNISIENPVDTPPFTQVAGTVSGGDGNDTITLSGGMVHRIKGNGGNDLLNMSGGATNLEIDLGNGDNTATFTNGTVGNAVVSGSGSDTIIVEGMAVINSVIGTGSGNDLITINDGSVGSINSGDGMDTILLNGGNVTGRIDWGAGNDSQILDLSGMSSVGHLRFGHGTDVFELTNGQVNGYVELGHQGYDEPRGNNSFTLSGGTIIGNILAGDQGDIIILNGGTVGAVQGGNGSTKRGTTGADTITLDGTTVNLDINGGDGPDQINIMNGIARDIFGGNGDDHITISGGNITNSVNGQNGDDNITLSNGLIGGMILGGAGNDTFSILDDFVIRSTTNINGGDDIDTIIIDTVTGRNFNGATSFENLRKDNTGVLTLTEAQSYSTSTAINGGTLDVKTSLNTPTVTMTTGNTTLNVNGIIEGITKASNITLIGSQGSDTISINSSGLLRTVGNLGNDTDVISVASGGILDTNGGTLSFGNGSDIATISGTLNTDHGIIDLAEGDDTLTLKNNAALNNGAVNGGVDSDTIIIDFGGVSGLTLNSSQIQNFETLIKAGDTNTLTLTGNHTFSDSIQINNGRIFVNASATIATTDVRVDTRTGLGVFGLLHNGEKGDVNFSPIEPFSEINIAAINGGILHATGDLGGGTDQVSIINGTLNSNDGFNLGDGDDRLVIMNNADINGLIDGGASTFDLIDATVSTGNTATIEQVLNFEILNKSGSGTLIFEDSNTSNFNTINLNASSLHVNGSVEVITINLNDGGTLNVNGRVDDGLEGYTKLQGIAGTSSVVNIAGTLLADGNLGDGADVLDVSGTLNTGTGILSLGDGDDTFTIHDGTTIIGTVDGGDDVSAADGWVDTLTYNSVTATAGASTVRNWENVVINGGSIAFADNALTVGSEIGLGLTISNGGTLNTSGGFTLTGNLDNTRGVINSQDGNAGDRIRVSGDYASSGQLRIDVDFTTGIADVLEVAGNVMGGETLIVINDVSSGQASGNDVLVVEVGGIAAADAFSSASVISGNWSYDLKQIGQSFYLNGTSARLSLSSTAYDNKLADNLDGS